MSRCANAAWRSAKAFYFKHKANQPVFRQATEWKWMWRERGRWRYDRIDAHLCCRWMMRNHLPLKQQQLCCVLIMKGAIFSRSLAAASSAWLKQGEDLPGGFGARWTTGWMTVWMTGCLSWLVGWWTDWMNGCVKDEITATHSCVLHRTATLLNNEFQVRSLFNKSPQFDLKKNRGHKEQVGTKTAT